MTKKIIYTIILTPLCIFHHTGSKGNNHLLSDPDESQISIVVIDPGHGGKDPGATSGSTREKDIVLDIATKLGDLIKLNYPETKVLYTRDRDIFIPLYQRAAFANKNKADLFISIHANAVDNRSVQGAETFILGQHRSQDNLDVAMKENAVILLEEDFSTRYERFDPNSPESYIMFELVQNEYLEQSVMFASSIQDQFRERANRKDRSVKQAGFIVLRRTTMPSVLIEVGFISHANERSFLTKEAGKTKMAASIFSAFKDYKKKIEDKSNFNLIVESINESTPNTNKPTEIADRPNAKNRENIHFSVQIAAAKRPISTTPSNFKGEKNVFRIGYENIQRYYSGKFNDYQDALREKDRLQSKFKGAFVVAFENDSLISLKKALGKM